MSSPGVTGYYGDTRTWSCNTGYTGSGTISCQSNGVWSGTPVCNIVSCGVLGGPANGAVSSPGVTGYYGDTRTWSCNTGYTGSGTVSCQSNGVWSGTPVCNIVSCGVLAAPANGGVSSPGVTGYYGDSRSWSCNTGYNGGGSASCQSNGAWSATPSCTIVSCGVLAAPANGAVSSPGVTGYYGDSRSWSCNTGYTGSGTITCQSNGAWSATPSCTIVSCGVLAAPANGAVSSPGVTGNYGDSRTWSCNTGYSGSGTVTCQSNGAWSATPVCTIVSCPALAAPANGAVSSPGVAGVYLNTRTWTCNTGYSGGGTSTCQATGSWSPTPSCTIVPCGVLAAPANGAVSSPGVSGNYGDTRTWSCNTGYTGSGTVTCQASGSWSPTPTCTIVSCGALSAPANGGISSTLSGNYGDTRTWTCNTGYLGASTSTCLAIGSWSPTPACTIVSCGVLAAPTNGAITNAGVAGTYGDTRTYSCNSGYYVSSGATTSTCQASGAWSGPAVVCSQVTCVGLSAPTNGRVSSTSTQLYGATVTLDCNPGYYGQSGSTSRTCQQDFSWSGTALVCTACNTNTYSAGYSTAPCTACSTPSSSTNGLTGQSACFCSSGYGGTWPTCTACGTSTYKSSNTDGTCTSCGAGATTTGVAPTSCACDVGFGGSWTTGTPNGCTACSSTSYKGSIGNVACTSCGTGAVSVLTSGSTFAQSCSCLAGYQPNAGATACDVCPANTYKPSSGNVACTTCGTGAVGASSTGANFNAGCTCVAGYQINAGLTACEPCPANSYKGTSGNTACTACGTGATLTSATGGTFTSSCSCQPGYQLNTAGTACEVCPAGTYKGVSGNFACSACGTGAVVTLATGTSWAAACTCVSGYTPNAGATACQTCAIGTYKGVQSNAACTACPGNSTTTAVGQTAQTSCQCLAGFGGDATTTTSGVQSCVICGYGKYKGSLANAACTQCPAGHTTLNLGSLASTDCKEVCGDCSVVGGETCDDCNTVSGDGCDSTCHYEPGWSCPVAGQACVRCGITNAPTNINLDCANTAAPLATWLASHGGALALNSSHCGNRKFLF